MDSIFKLPWSADEIAKNRLEDYLKDTLSKASTQTAWEFYTYLLDQAKIHALKHPELHTSEYIAYEKDCEQGNENFEKCKKERDNLKKAV